MPTNPFTGAEFADSQMLMQCVAHLAHSGETDSELMDAMLLSAAEPLQRTQKQEIGPERLSLARLQREAAQRGCNADDLSVSVYVKFGFRLAWLAPF